MSTPHDLNAVFALAQRTAAEFNKTHGVTLLVVQPPQDEVTIGELRALAQSRPGPYLAASAFEQIKRRRPTPGETIRFGRLLAALGLARRKDGPHTLWLLDDTAVARLS